MAAKKAWMTWMPTGEGAPAPQDAVAQMARAGLDVGGAAWVDDLEKAAWTELGTRLLEPGAVDLWVVAGRREDFARPRDRYGLSLTWAMVQAQREKPLPVFVLGLDFAPTPDDLPTLLAGFKPLSATQGGWPAKIVAGAFAKAKPGGADWRFNVIAHPLIGQWFEVGPVEGTWEGVLMGVSEPGKITHHAVGPKGELPERAVLEYPTCGIEAEVGGTRYTAWSVRNRVGPDVAYFVKVDGFPERIVFGGNPEADDAEVVVLRLS
jgi:hypothetical protein